MSDDPLDAVYSFVERAYVRLQAGDILIRCLDEDSSTPIQQFVEGLILAGPQSLNPLREILAEVEQRKAQAQDDLHQVFSEFEGSLKSYGAYLTSVKDAFSLLQLTSVRFLSFLREQNINEEKAQIACLQLLKDSRELMVSMARHIRLLEEIEAYLRDWIWGLAYQSTRQDDDYNQPVMRDLSH